MIKIRKAREADFEAIWGIFHEVVNKGDTFAFAPESTREECKALARMQQSYVGKLSGRIF